MHITNLLSQYFGKFAKKEFPNTIQKLINNSYAKIMKLDLTEFKSAKHYKSLNELFTRELIIKREIDNSENIFISPTDSLITECGKLEKDIALQIKGMQYSVEELLTYYCSSNFDRLKDGNFMNFYLSPKDYHRYHAPIDFKLKKLIHVPGKLYPVNLKYLNKEFELFVQNERVILECESNGKLFYMVFVGALNVGQMVFEFEKSVETNKDTSEIKVYNYDNIEISKADCLGYFKMGSTVVMLWEKDFVKLEELLNKDVKFGQKIAKF
ncbi:phosphatidylserine decarboxylase [Arcobacter porcinus]|uniref:phosphatidylserine decarboxylase n=1 Tax=Arcobacter porcinus TaxID=1935204 RepID=A0A1C0AY16_9BACT|nr:phosphatidylserine decarboxylase [Arcobacter porcinus]OCL94512.1 Phosphatidylserine decarboxylase proenzyme [Aliarcobacter thereius]OCL83111.1 Phosphatidylserine decarboxylase proenzyme [Arcobacter porcinus]OCL88170.1 Phosphatidylserine decarboxylase proenzyme [Arcobacter porcinus]OCL92545.1 Phosphatidylserine decarboxylase proenzyme [Arcobacter porcinus]QEP41496.1 phosphatidylserine decarboxylase, proenzyme [Arcobacter porcinus]